MATKLDQRKRASRSLALRRGLDLLCHFDDAHTAWGVTELARKMKVHKSLIHRTVKTLEDTGFLCQDAQTKQYSLGFTSYCLGVFAGRRLGFTSEIRTFFRRLADEIEETVYIVVREGDANRIVDTFETSSPIRFQSPVGTMIPWNRGASSKLLYAYAPEADLKQMIRRHGLPVHARRTITDERAFRENLKLIRKRGYSTSDNEGFDDILGIAAPIFAPTGELMVALQTSMSSIGLSDKRRKSIIAAMVRVAAEVTELLRRTSRSTS